jgi:hypothetical protein
LSPRGVESEKRKRQYEHLNESKLKRGGISDEDAERIATATTNKTKKKKGETKL